MSTVSEHHLAGKKKKNWGLFLKPLLLILILGGGTLLYHFTSLKEFLTVDHLRSFIQMVRETWWSPFVLILASGLSGFLALPVTPFSLLIGATYPFSIALVYNLVALNLGSSLNFLLARYLGRGFISHFFKGKLERFDEHSAKHGFRLIFYLRVVPLFPFMTVNYGAGLSKIQFRDYFWGTFLGILPGASIVTYFASALMAGTVAKKQVFWNLVFSGLLFSLISIIPLFVKRRQALKIKRALEDS